MVVSVLGLLALLLLRSPRGSDLPRFGAAMLVVLAVQVALGIGNVLWSLPLPVATAHNAVGAALLLVLVSVNYRLLASTRASPA